MTHPDAARVLVVVDGEALAWHNSGLEEVPEVAAEVFDVPARTAVLLDRISSWQVVYPG